MSAAEEGKPTEAERGPGARIHARAYLEGRYVPSSISRKVRSDVRAVMV